MATELTVDVSQIPVIDISSPVSDNPLDTVANQIRQACLDTGFFYIVEHGVDKGLQNRLEQLSRQFFARYLETKMQIRMALGGRAWRGYFPVGGELTNSKPDLKEGIYFGSELNQTHPAVRAGVPMHGANLFPDIPLFRETILEYLAVMTQLGQTLLKLSGLKPLRFLKSPESELHSWHSIRLY
ncbi:2-oxoglutarate and iron-dependent oxygenase domain-containing protein [Microcoleus sp. A003_D6]|uniref:2-oxoglutarate and iron-dependent oxygenase domain-containing protein n=1 Tax=Microcoleus sp. A003_D6 TaxID=3055266 RepID=UPI002FD53581